MFRRQLNNYGSLVGVSSGFVTWENDKILTAGPNAQCSMYTNGASRISVSLDNYATSAVSVTATLFVEPLSNCLTADFLPPNKTGTPASPSGLVVTSAIGASNYVSIPCCFEIMALFLETSGAGLANVGILLVGWNGQN